MTISVQWTLKNRWNRTAIEVKTDSPGFKVVSILFSWSKLALCGTWNESCAALSSLWPEQVRGGKRRGENKDSKPERKWWKVAKKSGYCPRQKDFELTNENWWLISCVVSNLASFDASSDCCYNTALPLADELMIALCLRHPLPYFSMRLSAALTYRNPLSVITTPVDISVKINRTVCWQATTKDDAEMTTPTAEAKQRRRVNTNNKNNISNNKRGCCCLSVNSLPSMWYGFVAVGLQVKSLSRLDLHISNV